MTYVDPSISTYEWNQKEHAGKLSDDSYLQHFCKLPDKFQEKQMKSVTIKAQMEPSTHEHPFKTGENVKLK